MNKFGIFCRLNNVFYSVKNYVVYIHWRTYCHDISIFVIYHLSSFTYSAMKVLEHVRSRCAMRSACGNSVMARCARKDRNFSRKHEKKNISGYVADFCEQFRSAKDEFRVNFCGPQRHISKKTESPTLHIYRTFIANTN